MSSDRAQSASSPTKVCVGNIEQHRHHQDYDDDDDSANCRSRGFLHSAFGSSNKKSTTVAATQSGVVQGGSTRPTCAYCSKRPICLFRGGEMWNQFELDRESLYLDLLLPVATTKMKDKQEMEEGKSKDKCKRKEKEIVMNKGKVKGKEEVEEIPNEEDNNRGKEKVTEMSQGDANEKSNLKSKEEEQSSFDGNNADDFSDDNDDD
ncbi:hypothetical protein PAAG_09042 [Paracoccidioides lutzii Pb01]|uniref:Uncharacterized protein n=1 Tax=Paracoccidioides lutzii (strain ATCC MYA-826 / Pb01) TaxID=502779 RepID=C1HE49_PARBA|nr:hypothetical protein PAAG_09042 [Paracoccidioides lutzii Pb01]EEH40589.2 hypothetical protein PAAG_09042 [Paracoccidioides lutzii Pb01]